MLKRIAFVMGVALASCGPPTDEDHATGIAPFPDPTDISGSIAVAEAGDREEAYKLFLHYQEAGELQTATEWLEVSALGGWPPAIRDRALLMMDSSDVHERAEGREMLQAYLATIDQTFVGDRALISHERAVLSRRLSETAPSARGG